MSHVNKVIDADPHFVIDINTRNIRNMSQTKVSLVQYDHNSERFSFTLPRFVEGHDMLECNGVQVHYFSSANPDTKGVYAITDLAICEEDAEKVCCTWLISQNVTQTAGAIQFMLRFACVAEDGTVEYAWHTNTFTGISISAGMNNAEAVVEQHADILQEWHRQLFEDSAEGVENITTAKETALTEVETAGDIACNVVENKGKNVAESLPDDYIALSEKVKNVAYALKGTVSGQAVTITDVSPVEHTIDVKVRSKNVVKNAVYLDVPYKESTTVYGSPISISFSILANKTYTVSFDTENTGALLTFVTYNKPYKIVNGTQGVVADGTRKTIVITTTEDYSYDGATILQVRPASTADSSGLCSNFMIEEGEVATDYTEYMADVSTVLVEVSDDNGRFDEVYPTSEGIIENVVSSYPSMTIIAMNTRAVVDVTYNKDLNKAFVELEEKLTNAIISLGGNV